MKKSLFLLMMILTILCCHEGSIISPSPDQKIITKSITGTITSIQNVSAYKINSFRDFKVSIEPNGNYRIKLASNTLPQFIFLTNQFDSLVVIAIVKDTDSSAVIDGRSTVISIVFFNVVAMGVSYDKADNKLVDFIKNLPEIENVSNQISTKINSGVTITSLLDDKMMSIVRVATAKSINFITGTNRGTEILSHVNSFFINKDISNGTKKQICFENIQQPVVFKANEQNNAMDGIYVLPSEQNGIESKAVLNSDGTIKMTITNKARRHINYRKFSKSSIASERMGPGKPITNSILGRVFDSGYDKVKDVDVPLISEGNNTIIEACGPGMGNNCSNRLDLFFVEPFSRTITSLACSPIELIFSSLYLGSKITGKAADISFKIYNIVSKSVFTADVVDKLNNPNPDYFKAIEICIKGLLKDPTAWQEFGNIMGDELSTGFCEDFAQGAKSFFSTVDILSFCIDMYPIKELSQFTILPNNITPPDIVPPKIEILSPNSTTIINSLIEVKVHVTDQSKISYIGLGIDQDYPYNYSVLGTKAPKDTTVIYSWNTQNLESGSMHYLYAYARDEYGNQGASLVKNISLVGSSSEKILLSDNFDDGDFTRNPTWNLNSGKGCASFKPIVEVINNEFHVKQSGAGGCGNGGFIEYPCNIIVTNNTTIKFDVKPGNSTVRGGDGDSHSEYPIMIRLELLNSDNITKQLFFNYGCKGGQSVNQSNFISVSSTNCTLNVWKRNESFIIWNYFPNVTTLTKIIVGGQGWDYEGWCDNIQIYE